MQDSLAECVARLRHGIHIHDATISPRAPKPGLGPGNVRTRSMAVPTSASAIRFHSEIVSRTGHTVNKPHAQIHARFLGSTGAIRLERCKSFRLQAVKGRLSVRAAKNSDDQNVKDTVRDILEVCHCSLLIVSFFFNSQ